MRRKMIRLAIAAFAIGTVSTSHAFTVDARNNSSSGGIGLDTNITLSAGQLFTVAVNPNDLWSAGNLPRWSNANGLTGILLATGADESGQAAGTQIGANFGLWTQGGFSAPYGALVGELSNQFFLIGTNFTGPAPVAGELHLFYWDSNSGDNTEHIEVAVRAPNQTVPEPATLGLLGLALAGLGLSRRKQS